MLKESHGPKQVSEINKNKMDDERTVKVKNLHVSWKWPVRQVFSGVGNVRPYSRCREPQILISPVHKNAQCGVRGILPTFEYKKISWPCTRKIRK